MDWIDSLIGGLLIGSAASMMLFLNGRVTGISGIIYGLMSPKKQETAWCWYFVIGLLVGGLIMWFFRPEDFSPSAGVSWARLTSAGLLVGFGTALGSGCTSGHGVCGVSRLSRRSLLATALFIAAGVCTVLIVRWSGL